MGQTQNYSKPLSLSRSLSVSKLLKMTGDLQLLVVNLPNGSDREQTLREHGTNVLVHCTVYIHTMYTHIILVIISGLDRVKDWPCDKGLGRCWCKICCFLYR